jgi:UTP--glucose-1-phosphate uridylyltransferase
VFEPALLEYLQKNLETYTENGEFMIQEAMQQMINDGRHIYGCEIKNGTYYDTGNPLEYLKTVFEFALQRDDIAPALTEFMREKLK